MNIQSLRLQNFEIYHINEEIAIHKSKCHFSHPGSCTRITYLHILENQRKLHQKSAKTFLGLIERCADTRLQCAKCVKRIMKILLCYNNKFRNFKTWSSKFNQVSLKGQINLYISLFPSVCVVRQRAYPFAHHHSQSTNMSHLGMKKVMIVKTC